MSPLELRFCDIQITTITNFVVVLSVGIKWADCIYLVFLMSTHNMCFCGELSKILLATHFYLEL